MNFGRSLVEISPGTLYSTGEPRFIDLKEETFNVSKKTYPNPLLPTYHFWLPRSGMAFTQVTIHIQSHQTPD